MYSYLKMVTLDNYGLSAIFLLVFYFRTSHTYVKRCPEMGELVIFTKVKCFNDYEYHCLALHRIAFNNYKEECRPPEWVSLGNYPVLRGRYIDYETCPVSSYQPYLFRSNERSKCTYLKSICSSDGQVKVNDGTTTSDKACRCDYNRGYAFVIRPQNQSACIPSQEDCSCYSKPCEKVQHQHLNPDYECKTLTVLHGNSTYHAVTVTSKENTSHNAKYVVTNLKNSVSGKEGHFFGLIALKSLIVFVILMISAFSIASCIYLTKKTPSNQAVSKDPTIQEMNQTTEISLMKTETDSSTPTEKAEINLMKTDSSTPTEKAEINLIKTETDSSTPKEKAVISLMKTETDSSTPTEKAENNLMKTKTDSSTPTENTDIVILHIEEEKNKTEVESFKFHLESLSKKMGYSGINIKMFDDIFHKKEDDSDFEIETVLKKCNYVFAYISDNFYTSKLRRLGLKEWCIKDALNDPETKKHITIVRNCKYLPRDWHLSLQQEDVDLDFFEYDEKNPGVVMKYHKFYEDCLKNIQHNDETK
ncbi:uncharacterized protein LOC143066398 [Mytilus galloprovincialis]|uniref:uncharacterized protein LOC143066398 n=1 Tax=Mytilus galloprovincialis TaxID=29158 RepID=UPI003F7C06BA